MRSERTRQIVVEAYLDLLRADPRAPTAAQIAAKAGVSVRSIFERFSDLNALSLAAADYAIVQAQAESVARDVDGDRPTRIRSHVHTRAMACERWLPLWRIIIGSQQSVAELRTRVVLTRYANIERMRLMYSVELKTMPEAEREQLLKALATLVSFESWDQLRDCYTLSVEDAEATWRAAIDRLLPATP